jgi:hypothetical protein
MALLLATRDMLNTNTLLSPHEINISLLCNYRNNKTPESSLVSRLPFLRLKVTKIYVK